MPLPVDPFAPVGTYVDNINVKEKAKFIAKDPALKRMMQMPPTRISRRGFVKTAQAFIETGYRAIVVSSNVSTIRYHWRTERLYVQFKGGSMGYYHDVPPKVAVEFFLSPSLGKFLHRRLKGVFPWVYIKQ